MSNYHFILVDPVIDSEETILQLKTNAMNLLFEIKTIMEYQGEATSAKREMVTELENIIMDCNRALKIQNPSKYGIIVRQSGIVRVR